MPFTTGDLGTLRVKFESSMEGLLKGIETAKVQLKGFTDYSMNEIRLHREGLNTLGMGMSAIGAATAGMAILSIKSFGDFEAGMKNVQAVSKATGEQYQQLTNFAKDMALVQGEGIVTSAKKASEALYFIASAGYNVADQMTTAKNVMMLASATNYDLSRSADFTVQTLNAFGKTAKDSGHLADVLTEAVNRSTLTMERLDTGLPYLSGSFGQLKWSMESAAAALAIMVDRGMKAESAGEYLRGSINALLDPTDKMIGHLKSMGLTIDQLNPQTHSLAQIVQTLKSANMSAADATALFGERAGAMQRLVAAGADELERFEKNLINSGGAAQETARIQEQSLNKQMEHFKNQLEVIAINIGEGLIPALNKMMGPVKDLTGWFSGLSQSTQNLVAQSGLVVGALTGITGASILLIARLPEVISGFTALISLSDGLRMSLWGMGTSLTAVSTALAALGASIWAGVRIYNAATKEVDAHAVSLEATKQNANNLNEAYLRLENAASIARSRGLDPMKMTLGELNTATGAYGASAAELGNTLGVHIDKSRSVAQMFSLLSKELSGTTTETTKSKEAVQQHETALGPFKDKVEQSTAAVKKFEVAFGDARTAIEAGERGIEQETEKLSKSTKGFLDNTGASIKVFQRDVTDGRRAMMTDLTKATDIGWREIIDAETGGQGTVLSQSGMFLIQYLSGHIKTYTKIKEEIEDVAQKQHELGMSISQSQLELQRKDEAYFQGRKDTEQDYYDQNAENLEAWLAANTENLVKERIAEDKFREENRVAWYEYFDSFSNGVGSISDSYRGLWEILHNSEMKEDDYRKKSIERFAEWAQKVSDTIHSIINTWNDFSIIIAKISQLLGGDTGGGVGAVAGAGGGTGLVGNLATLSSVGSKIGGVFSSIGSAASSAASGISSAAGAIAGFLAPAALLVGAGVGAYELYQWNSQRGNEPNTDLSTFQSFYGASQGLSNYNEAMQSTTNWNKYIGEINASGYNASPSDIARQQGTYTATTYSNSAMDAAYFAEKGKLQAQQEFGLLKGSGGTTNNMTFNGIMLSNDSSLRELANQLVMVMKQQGYIA